MKVFNMIKFIGSKNTKYKWENIINDLPCKPIEGKGFLDNNGNRQGLWGTYYKNGQLDSKGSFKDDKKDGIWEYYWDNGQLMSKGSFKDDKQDGIWERYHENGQSHSKGLFKDGKKDGIWEYYYKNGQLWSKGLFKDGKYVKTILKQ
jgi:antitoxin component YwqK of YwqJK toxin-antitoxin module